MNALPFVSAPILQPQHLIARGARMAEALDAELYVIYVDMGQDAAEHYKKRFRQTCTLRKTWAPMVRVQGKTVAAAVAEVVHEKHITHVFFGRSATTGWRRYLYISAIHRFLRDAPAVDVHIVTQGPT